MLDDPAPFECQESCLDTPLWNVPTAHRLRRSLRTPWAWLERLLGRCGDLVLRWQGIALVAAFALAMVVWIPESAATRSRVSLSVGSGEIASATVSSAAVAAQAVAAPWQQAIERLAGRWQLVLALTGLVSVFKVFQSVTKGQSRYLSQDIVVEPAQPGDARAVLTTSVENKLDDDKRIHNAILLVGREGRDPERMLEQLEQACPAVAERIRCGRRLRTWEMIEVRDPRRGLLLRQAGSSDGRSDRFKERIEVLLRACPLPHRCSAGSGAEYCSVESVSFYMTENDNIANESIHFPVSFPVSALPKDVDFTIRFYMVGEKLDRWADVSSRCTARDLRGA